MSVSDFGLLFASILLIFVFFHYIYFSNYQAVQSLQTEYNLAIDQAVEAALYDAAESDTQREFYMNEDSIIDSFFQALYVNLGIMEEPMKKELCKFYIPYILFVEEDGIVPYVQVNSKSDEIVSFESGKKILYQFEGDSGDVLQVRLDDFIQYKELNMEYQVEGYYQDVVEKLPDYFRWSYEEFLERKQVRIITLIKECSGKCIVNQNQIAKRFGIDYEFTLPTIEYEEWYRTIKDISMVVLFQGYPFGNGVTGRFNRAAIGGARISKKLGENPAS